MEKNLYIDASHPNETRVVLKSNGNIEDYEYEGIKNTLIKNNIYVFYDNTPFCSRGCIGVVSGVFEVVTRSNKVVTRSNKVVTRSNKVE